MPKPLTMLVRVLTERAIAHQEKRDGSKLEPLSLNLSDRPSHEELLSEAAYWKENAHVWN